jgi:outer membrane cobalamin receptor
MKYLICFCIGFFIAMGYVNAQTNHGVLGKVVDSTGAPLIGAIIRTSDGTVGTATDEDGVFKLTLPPGQYTIIISNFGYKEQQKNIQVNKNVDVMLTITMEVDIDAADEVVVTGKAPNENVTNTKMGATEITVEEIKTLPALFGEVDIVKNIQTLPGVQVAGDGNTGLYVRGGGADQNLILVDEAPVYNASHLFGIFSIFNADAIQSAELYKAGIPSQYGGRLSSLVDVRLREGAPKNSKKFSARGGIGIIASRLTVEGTFAKDKGSYIFSGRRSYADLFLQLSSNPDTRKNKLYFYDLNGKVNYRFNKNNSMYISSYYGKDQFKFGGLFGMGWGNFTFTANWHHIFSDKVFLNTIYTHSEYRFNLGIGQDVQAFEFKTGIVENSIKQDYQYIPNIRHAVHFGWSVSQRQYNPGSFVPTSSSSIFESNTLPLYHSLEGALFVSNKQKLSEKLTLDYGLRLNMFNNVGSGTVYNYNGDPVTGTKIDSTVYKKGEIINTFWGLEPRIAARYILDEQSSVKLGFNRNYQYIHQISNSLTPVPFDVWVPSNTYFKPEAVNQYSAGYFRNLKDNTYETSVEGYYKSYTNSIDYIDNANLLMNPQIETQARVGKAWSYGAEFFLKKKKGRLTGWVSYTLSWSYKKIDGINNGQKYFAGYDRRHNLNVIASYKLSDRVTFGGQFVFGTGRPIGLPNGGYSVDGYWLGVYPERNSFRLPSYHRLDLSVTINQRKKEGRKWEGSWSFSIYNVYGFAHINPWTVVAQTNKDTGNKEYVAIYFPAPIPSVTYNFKF